jgi:hypothetical protein
VSALDEALLCALIEEPCGQVIYGYNTPKLSSMSGNCREVLLAPLLMGSRQALHHGSWRWPFRTGGEERRGIVLSSLTAMNE